MMEENRAERGAKLLLLQSLNDLLVSKNILYHLKQEFVGKPQILLPLPICVRCVKFVL